MKKFNEFKLNEEDEYDENFDYDTQEELDQFIEQADNWFFDNEDSIDEFGEKITQLVDILDNYNEWLETHGEFEAEMTIGNMTGLNALSNIEPNDLRTLGKILEKIQNR